MPVEIREMVIKAIVPARSEQEEAHPSTLPAESDSNTELVQRCVAEVMKILEKKARR